MIKTRNLKPWSLILLLAIVLLGLPGCNSQNKLEQELRDYLMASLRENYDLYPVSTYEDVKDVSSPQPTGEPNHFKISVRFGDSKDVPFEIWADNSKPLNGDFFTAEELHYKCLLGSDGLDRIVYNFKNGAKANAPLGNTKWDGVWTFGDSWTIKLNSNTDEAIVNGKSCFWQDGGDYAVIGVDKTSVLYMRKDGHLYTGDNKGNVSVDFGFSLKKQ